MRWIRLIGLAVFSLTILMTWSLFGATTGKLSGVVTDKQTGLPIPGARIMIDKTSMGALVNPADGSYVILNVPPGVYSLVSDCIGYNKLTVTNVTVNADVTTEINFELVSEVVRVGDITVEAKRPDITKAVSTEVHISRAAIDALPVQTIEGVLKAQTGVVSQGGALHVRGSRAGEVGIVDDGVLIKDQLGGYGGINAGGSDATPISRLSMNFSAQDVEDISIMKGNYSAEYGDVSGALITTQRREGNNRATKFGATFLTDDLGSKSLNKYSFNQDRLDMNLNGPVPLISDKLFPKLGLKWPGEKMAYYASFSVDKSDGFVDYNNYGSAKSKIDYGHEDFLGIQIPNRRVNKYTSLAKLTWKLDPNSKYKLNLRYSKDWDNALNFSYNFLYNPQNAGYIKSDREIYSISLSFNPSFLHNTYGEVLYSQVKQTYQRLPGKMSPSNFYVPIMAGAWEIYVDANGNGKWDAAEKFVDLNGNNVWDIGEPFEDINGNGQWDDAEIVYNDVNYVDTNNNGVYDDGDSTYYFVDTLGYYYGDGVYNEQLAYNYNTDDPEPYFDGDSSLGEPFTDVNGNGVYNREIDIWSAANDLDHNGRYTGPNDPWSQGIPYVDRNSNSRYDAPNGRYDYGEAFVDVNGNGKWDNTDGFLDSGFDRWAQYHYDYTRTRTLKFDMTSQLSRHHQLKSGFEFKFHRIEYQDLQYPYNNYNGVDDGGPWSNITRLIERRDTNGDGIADTNIYQTYSRGVFRDFYTRTPKDGAFYIKDKMEYGEMIADIGLRYEFFIQAREAKDSLTLSKEGIDMLIVDSHQKLAPRVGFAFPISDKAKLMFNYGHFYQRPGFSKYYQRATQASNAFSVIGNANIDYEKTILYEVGVQYAITEGYRLDFSGYYKDQYGLLNTVPVSLASGSSEVQSNVDYARARGLEVEFEKRYGQFLAGSIKYEYTFAYGKSSSDRSDYYIRFAGGEISIKENPLDWDIRHTLTFNSSITVLKDEHPHFGIIKLPDNWNASILWQFKTGQPFTPSSSYPGLHLRTGESPLPNSKRKPATSSVDVSLEKNFVAYGLNYSVQLSVNNIFNTRNVYDVYSGTGLAYSNRSYNGQILTGQDIDADPLYYLNGRQVLVGLSVEF